MNNICYVKMIKELGEYVDKYIQEHHEIPCNPEISLKAKQMFKGGDFKMSLGWTNDFLRNREDFYRRSNKNISPFKRRNQRISKMQALSNKIPEITPSKERVK